MINLALTLPNSNSSHKSLPAQKASALSYSHLLLKLITIYSSSIWISLSKCLVHHHTSITTTTISIDQFVLSYDLKNPCHSTSQQLLKFEILDLLCDFPIIIEPTPYTLSLITAEASTVLFVIVSLGLRTRFVPNRHPTNTFLRKKYIMHEWMT